MPENPPGTPTGRIDIGAAVVAALAMVVAGAALWEAREFSPLGSIFPRTIGIALLITAFAAMLRALMGRSVLSKGVPRDGLLRSALLMLTMVLWIALLSHVGFIVTSVVAFFALAIIADREPATLRRLVAFAIVAVVVVVAFDLVFVRLLNVTLPGGMLM